MLFSEYERWLHDSHSRVILEPSFVEVGPIYSPTREPESPPWNMDWSIRFPDDHFIRIKDRWMPLPKPYSRQGVKRAFSYHYGITSGKPDSDGHPAPSTSRETIFRIDRASDHGEHIHYEGEDHIAQARIEGLVVAEWDPFKFFETVMKQRASNKTFSELLGFTVRK